MRVVSRIADVLKGVKRLHAKCRKVETPFLWTLFHSLILRTRGINIVPSRYVEIQPSGIIETGGLVQIGMDYVGFMSRNDRTYLNIEGTLVFHGEFNIGKGCRIYVGKNAIAQMGGSGYINPNCQFVIMHGLAIGEGCAISWGCQFLDEDFHKIENNKVELENSKEIKIGKHVWIGSNVTVLKGVVIPDNCVIATGSIVTKPFSEENCLIGGVPARILKRDISWS